MKTMCQLAAIAGLLPGAVYGKASDSMLDLDARMLVSRADLHFTAPAARSEERLPIGNGRVGTLVWTTPSALRFRINRVDVFANNCAIDSFPERHTDYCGGCGFVDLEFADYGAGLFSDDRTAQHLSCYDGLAAVQGRDIKIRTRSLPSAQTLGGAVTTVSRLRRHEDASFQPLELDSIRAMGEWPLGLSGARPRPVRPGDPTSFRAAPRSPTSIGCAMNPSRARRARTRKSPR